jgi:hypothetical protein
MGAFLDLVVATLLVGVAATIVSPVGLEGWKRWTAGGALFVAAGVLVFLNHRRRSGRTTSAELKRKVLDFITRAREWLALRERSDREMTETALRNAQAANSPEQHHDRWMEMNTGLTRRGNDTKHEFARLFKIDAILIRDQLWERLPVDRRAAFDMGRLHALCDWAGSPLAMAEILDTLELIAKQLPDDLAP